VRRPFLLAVGVALLLLGTGVSLAASLRVAPTIIDLVAPDAAATLNLRNDDARPIDVQIRVFRWRQAGLQEQHEPTTDVVASPPATRLGPKEDYVIRVVRVSTRPVVGEESYRVVIDELPDPSQRKAGTVRFVLRHVIPVFYRASNAAAADVSWTVQPAAGGFVVRAQNNGARRLKVFDLRLTDGSGRIVARRDGLVGYVLGHATMEWSIPAAGAGSRSGAVSIVAQSEDGPINAAATVQGR
jgi:fimbrial chaperone protein